MSSSTYIRENFPQLLLYPLIELFPKFFATFAEVKTGVESYFEVTNNKADIFIEIIYLCK